MAKQTIHVQQREVNNLLTNVLLLSLPNLSNQIAPYNKAMLENTSRLEVVTANVFEALF